MGYEREFVKQLKINSFRGIKDLTLADLRQINILTGKNNCGKTSILEILESYRNPIDFRNWRQILRNLSGLNQRSRISYYEGFYDLFDVNSKDKVVEYEIMHGGLEMDCVRMTGEINDVEISENEWRDIQGIMRASSGMNDKESEENDSLIETSLLQLRLFLNEQEENMVQIYDGQYRFMPLGFEKGESRNIVYISPTAHAEGMIYLKDVLDNPDLYQEMLNALSNFNEDIISINYDVPDKGFMGRGAYKLLSKSYQRALPLNVYGDGMKKAILLMSAVVRAHNGILLLDEFETAIHASAMKNTFQWILRTCLDLNVQVFMTSHSIEAINKVLKCDDDLRDEINLYTLYKQDSKSFVRKMNCEEAIRAQDEWGMELR